MTLPQTFRKSNKHAGLRVYSIPEISNRGSIIQISKSLDSRFSAGGRTRPKAGAFFYPLFFLTFLILYSSSSFALTVPSEHGRVEETHPGTNGKTIVLIQEAHVDYGAQKAIAEILRSLIERDSLRLIMVEGGWDHVNLDYLRSYGTPEGRLKVAEQYLKEGKISGEEYLNVTTELPMELWGIEDKALYDENMRAFLAIHEKQKPLLEEIAKLRAGLAKQEESAFSNVGATGRSPLRELIAKKESFEGGKIGLVEYINILLSFPHGLRRESGSPTKAFGDDEKIRANDALKSFPHLANILAASGTGAGFDIEKVEYEKAELIKALSRKMTKPEFELLSVMAERKSPEEEINFLTTLLENYETYPDLAKKVSVANLRAYAKSLEEVTLVESEKVFEELAALEAQIGDSLAKTPEAKELLLKIRALASLKKLFELKLSPEEFRQFQGEGKVEFGKETISGESVSRAAGPTSQAETAHQPEPGISTETNKNHEGQFPRSPKESPFLPLRNEDQAGKYNNNNTSERKEGQASRIKNQGGDIYRQNRRENFIQIFTSFFSQPKHASEISLSTLSTMDYRLWTDLEAAIPLAKAFYDAATAREAAMIRNADEKLSGSSDSLAALIVGGFHAKEIASLFRKKGYTVVLISPRFNPSNSESEQNKYFEILKYKWGASSKFNAIPSQGGIPNHATQQ